MDYSDMLEQVDALAAGMTPAERGFVDVLMDSLGALTPGHHQEIQRLYDHYVRPLGYDQTFDPGDTPNDVMA